MSEDGGEAVAGGEVEHLDPAVAGVALVPGALPQRHLRLVCVCCRWLTPPPEEGDGVSRARV